MEAPDGFRTVHPGRRLSGAGAGRPVPVRIDDVHAAPLILPRQPGDTEASLGRWLNRFRPLVGEQKTRYTILFSHGNAEDLGDLSGHLEQFRQHGFSAIAYDYSGYGTSSGKPTERAARLNVEAVYDYLVTKRGIAPDRIIIWGRSIGSGPSVHLAANRPAAGLVIECGFVSAFRVLTRVRLLPFDRFDNLRALERVTCPVLIIHGTDDEIIPFWHGQRLFDTAREPKSRLWVERAGHKTW